MEGKNSNLFPLLKLEVNSSEFGVSELRTFFREGIKDNTCGHTEEADEKGEVIGFGWIRGAYPWIGFDHSSQGWHEDRCTSHGEEIDKCHHSGRDSDGEEFFGMRIDHHSKAGEKAQEKENGTVPEGTLDIQHPDQREKPKAIETQSS